MATKYLIFKIKNENRVVWISKIATYYNKIKSGADRSIQEEHLNVRSE